ncbi:preprotein translocase subunit SecA [Aristaeella lactis]|uniref:Preprotein translocase subunit SecA n=1 Tax=Aristaeella lactis TaxID=3046383 RepID=A0AC61PQL4_9FIRM|nr:preprotein translocase subunit SecA [Aristaeella lactis]QUA52366.1 preprotein translocase subunit SecA [Aristaeella lactis]SMC92500.1 preprotein translocase subunit SecA [Aristaeella lactis]
MLEFLKKVLGSGNEVQLKKLNKPVEAVMALEEEYRALTDEQLQAKTAEFRQRLQNGETEDDILPEAFATVREAADRVLGMRPYRVQVLGGIVLHQGRIAEMKTGEGKTLVATMPAYLNALCGKGVHVVTVNDYLARRDSEWMGKVYRFLGLTVGLIVHDLEPEERRAAYACDITYGTNNELGFDYLRDNMVIRQDNLVQRGHAFAIVDEVDSILIDEARTPLIISGQGEKSTELYDKVDAVVRTMKPEIHFEIEEKKKAVTLTDEGARKVETAFGIDNINDAENSELNHHVYCALRAHNLMKRDVDYVVQNGQVIIVDEFTGRLMIGRRYSEGLHQAIEAKEHVKVERESKTLATITFQNYFRMYEKLSGMTGTAKTEETEFQGIYALDVVEIPTNKPNIRVDQEDMVYKNKAAKFNAVVASIEQYHAKGQPLLVGTISVEVSEMLSDMLKRKGIPHEVLNAKNHAKEAEIVAQAGHYGAVTIATNMAGRGTDILLGGNPEFLARRALRQEGVDEEVIEEAVGHNEHVSDEVLEARKRYQEHYSRFKADTDREHERVLQTGGLHIIGTERHESRRIDNQLRGRSGRQGDPGSTQFFISLEDDLMRLFGSERIGVMVDRLGLRDDEPLTAGLLTKQIENAQKRIENRNFESRKYVLEYDDVMNRQRGIIYGQRRRVLMGENVRDSILRMADHVIDFAAGRWMNGENTAEWEWKEAANYLENLCCHHGALEANRAAAGTGESRNEFIEALKADARTFYEEREKLMEDIHVDMRELERVMLLRSVDSRWMDHIDAMDQLRDGIGFRQSSGKNPVTEYQIEAGHMFEELNHLIREDTVRRVYQTKVEVTPERVQTARPIDARVAGDGPRQPRRVKPSEKIGRNDPCPCGSGKKYKNCCMLKENT